MAFTWKPLESHRAHTLSTSLWPGMEIAAILFAITRAEKRGHYTGMRQERRASTGSLQLVRWLGIVIGQQSKDDFHPGHFSFSHTSSCSICVLPVHVAQAQVLLKQEDRSRLAVWQVQDFSSPAQSRETSWLWRLKWIHYTHPRQNSGIL